jgi:hypothetical protein
LLENQHLASIFSQAREVTFGLSGQLLLKKENSIVSKRANFKSSWLTH